MRCINLVWLCLTLVTVAAGATLSACRTTPTAAAPGVSTMGPAPAAAGGAAMGEPDSPAPPLVPGLDPDRAAPLAGEALERATRPLSQVLKNLDTPAFLAEAVTSTSPASADTEPSPAAQRAYVAARLALFEGRVNEAIDQLESARNLAPRRPDILALLGRGRLASGDRAGGVVALEQAVKLDPRRADTLFMLGREAMQRRRWPRAAAIFHALLEGANDPINAAADPAIEPLSHYHLAVALGHMGAAQAAAEQYHGFFEAAAQAQPIASRFGREMVLLDRAQGQNHQTVGDLYQQLGRPVEARKAYTAAFEAGVPDRLGLVKRLVYTDLLLGRPADARQRVVDRVREHVADPDTLALVGYLGRHTDKPGPLVAALRKVYDDQTRQGQSTSLAITISDLLPPTQGRDFLKAHLRNHPRDWPVYEHLLGRLGGGMPPAIDGEAQAEAQVDPASLGEAIAVTASLMEAAPPLADRYASTLLRRARVWARDRDSTSQMKTGLGTKHEGGDDGGALAPGFATLDPAQAQTPNARVLEAMSLALAGQKSQAAAQLDQVIAANPDLVIARIQRIKLALEAAKTPLAARLLEPLKGSTDPSVLALRVGVLSDSGHPDKALALLSARIDAEDDPDTVTALVTQKARLQVKLNRFEQAERTVLEAMDARPDQAPLYALLFQVYGQAGNTTPRQYRELMRRMLANVPHSRLARLKVAQYHAGRQEYDQARALLSQLLDENPMDYNAVGLLARVEVAAGQPEEADALVDRKLAAAPRDPKWLILARGYYQQRGDKPRVLNLTERLLRLQPPSFERAKSMALIYFNTDRPRQAARLAHQTLRDMDRTKVHSPVVLASVMWRAMREIGQGGQAESWLKAAAKRFPDHLDALDYQRAALIDREGDAQRAARIMERILDRDPGNVEANNGLAYSYAVRGVHLDRALELIDRALLARPGTASFQDTKGWVLYKLGRFDDAITWLGKAIDALDKQGQGAAPGTRAVIQNHLGDALYRRGKPRDAAAAWRVVADLAKRGVLPEDDPEVASLGEKVNAKLDAAKRGEKPDLP